MDNQEKLPNQTLIIILVSTGLILLAIAGYFANRWKNQQVAKEHEFLLKQKPPVNIFPETSQNPNQISRLANQNNSDAELDKEEKGLETDLKILDSEIITLTKYLSQYTENQTAPESKTEIKKKTEILTSLIKKTGLLKKIDDSAKTKLTDDLKFQIENLVSQNSPPKQSTSSAIQIISTIDRRMYFLTVPKTQTIVAADKIVEIVDSINLLAAKLTARFSVLQISKQDADQLNNLFKETAGKITNAKSQAQNAVNSVGPLVSDQGDKNKFEANKSSFENAKSMLIVGQEDLKLSLQNIKSFQKWLKTNGLPQTTLSPKP